MRENERLDYPWTVDFHVKLAVSILNGGKHSKFRIHSEYCPPDVPHKDGTYIKFGNKFGKRKQQEMFHIKL